MAPPKKRRPVYASLEVILLMLGFACWTVLPLIISLNSGWPLGEYPFFLIPTGWVLIFGAVILSVLRLVRWAIELLGALKQRIGMK